MTCYVHRTGWGGFTLNLSLGTNENSRDAIFQRASQNKRRKKPSVAFIRELQIH